MKKSQSKRAFALVAGVALASILLGAEVFSFADENELPTSDASGLINSAKSVGAAMKKKSIREAASKKIIIPAPRHMIKKLPVNQMKKLVALATRIYDKAGVHGRMNEGHHGIAIKGKQQNDGSLDLTAIYLDKGIDAWDKAVEINPQGKIKFLYLTIGGWEPSQSIDDPGMQTYLRRELHFWLKTDAAKKGKIIVDDGSADITF